MPDDMRFTEGIIFAEIKLMNEFIIRIVTSKESVRQSKYL